MTAICDDNGLGSSAIGHIDEQTFGPALLDSAPDRRGVWRSYGNGPVNYYDVIKPNMNQLYANR